MHKQRLAEIEAYARTLGSNKCRVRGLHLHCIDLAEDMVPELIDEVRRLTTEAKQLRAKANDAYTEGRTQTEAEIIEILSYDDTDGEIIARLELYLGLNVT